MFTTTKPIIETFRLGYRSLAARAFSCFPVYPDRVSKTVLCVELPSNKLMAKRKAHSSLEQESPPTTIPIPVTPFDNSLPSKRRASQRIASQPRVEPAPANHNGDLNARDGGEAIRASPEVEELDERLKTGKVVMDRESHVKKEDKDIDDSDSPLSDLSNTDSAVKAGNSKFKSKLAGYIGDKSGITDERTDGGTTVQVTKIKQQPAKGYLFLDPEAEGDEEADEEEIQAALSRPPPVNSDYLPLPWRGRLGYVRREFSTVMFANFIRGLSMYVST